jgi:hypothetical protein
MNFPSIVRRHLDVSRNHESGLIPVSTQSLLTECAIEIERLTAVISNTRAMVDHVIHGDVSITSMQDIHSDLSKALKEDLK